jgi:hypothetical protein
MVLVLKFSIGLELGLGLDEMCFQFKTDRFLSLKGGRGEGRIGLNADKRSVFKHGGDQEGTGAAAVVENNGVGIGVLADEVTSQLYRFLGRMNGGFIPDGGRNLDDINWMTPSVIMVDEGNSPRDFMSAIVERRKNPDVSVCVRSMSEGVLGIIGGACPHTENENVFMLFKRHPVGVEKTTGPALNPDKLVGELFAIGSHEIGNEESLGKKNNVAGRAYDTAVFIPENIQSKRLIP